MRHPYPRLPWKELAVVAAAATGVGAGGLYYVHFEQSRLVDQAQRELTAVMRLKIGQISNWRAERIGDASASVENPSLVPDLVTALDHRNADTEAKLTAWASSLQRHYGYSAVFVVDLANQTRFAVGEKELDPEAATGASLLIAGGHVAMGDVRRGAPGAPLRIDVVAPIRRTAADPPIGTLVLRSNPRAFLFPIIESWPGSSRTAETLLVRREGSDVLFLNNIRHRAAASLDLRLPINDPSLPSAQALTGPARFFEGKDYRGVAVLAAVSRVPETTWGLVSKVDTEEVLTPARRARLLAFVAAMAGLLAVAAWTTATWRKQQTDLLKKELEARAARQDLELRLGAIADQANDIIVLLNEELHITEVNRRAVELWGYSRDELLNRKITELRAPSERLADPAFLEILKQGSRPYETVHRRKDGTEFPVEVTARPMSFEGKRVYQAIIRDVSRRKWAEAAQRESEQSLSATLHSIGDGVIAADAQGHVTRMNPVAEKLTGWSLSEAKGLPLDDVFRIISEKTRNPSASRVTQVLASGAVVAHTAHTLLIARDGSERPVLDSAAPIRNTEGAIVGVVLVFRDGTDERATEAALSYQAHLLANITETVLAVDPHLLLTAWNPAAEQTLGWTSREAIGRHLADVLPIHASSAASMETPGELMRALSNSEHTDEPLPILRRDGAIVPVQGRGCALRDDEGHTTGYVLVLRDISERLQLRAKLRLAERMTALGTLAAGVAHEINNPLTAIMGNLECTLEEPDSTPIGAVHDLLTEALEGAARVRRIVRDLKVLSRGDDERARPVNVVRVLQSAISVTQNEVRHRALLVTDFAEVPDVLAEESRLAQVFTNLLINAAQAIPEGHRHKNRIRVATKLTPAGRVAIEIEDTGCGISPDVRQRIFDPFYTTKRIGEGTGLGLSICHGIIARLGGEIRVESVVGKGSLFTLLVPRSTACSVEIADPGSRRPLTMTCKPRAKLLVIDDEPSVAHVVQRVFAGIHDVTSANSVKEALDLIATTAFDVVLCDLMMPELTGIDFFEALSSAAHGLAKKTIFLTGGAFTPGAQAFLERVENPRLDKPFEAHALRALVEEMLVDRVPVNSSILPFDRSNGTGGHAING